MKRRNEVLSFRATDHGAKVLKAAASRDGVAMSDWLRQAAWERFRREVQAEVPENPSPSEESVS